MPAADTDVSIWMEVLKELPQSQPSTCIHSPTTNPARERQGAPPNRFPGALLLRILRPGSSYGAHFPGW